MDIDFKGTYKSITEIEWKDIPLLAVITGTNGSGKTQLLELIYDTIINSPVHQERITITGNTYERGEVSFLKSEWILNNSQEMNLMQIQQQLEQLYQQFVHTHQTQHLPKLDYIFNETAKKIGRHRADKITITEFEKHFPIEYLQSDDQVTNQISRIFIDYNISLIEQLAGGESETDITQKIGPKPWVLLNEIMKEANLPFKFNDPESISLKDRFKLEITDTIRNCSIEFGNLSSGEKVLVSLVFFLYTSKEKKYFPKFLLLDEPDAHLHPSMAKQFLDVIKNVFIAQHNIRVMITTHSPSTVALTPMENLFEMRRTSPRIQKSLSKNKTISLLTAGLVIVGVGTRYFLVEDEMDVKFYQEIYSHLNANNYIVGDIPLVFIPASTATKSGGKSQVYSWVKKLSSSGLEDIIQGIIDKDSGNPASPGIYLLNRYSLENYLLDPLIVYAALMDRDLHPRIPGITLNMGEEYKLKTLSSPELQLIVDEIHSTTEPIVASHFSDFSLAEKTRVSITLITGQTLEYPQWLLNRRGKTLLNEIYNKAFPSNSIQPGSLMKAFKKTHFLPDDILALIKTLES
jgi:AAA15 family ATPase/GTPase